MYMAFTCNYELDLAEAPFLLKTPSNKKIHSQIYKDLFISLFVYLFRLVKNRLQINKEQDERLRIPVLLIRLVNWSVF